MADLEKKQVKKEDAIRELWFRGDLSWKCHPIQKEMRDAFYASSPHSKHVWLISRQLGKSFLLSILSIEQALKKPNSIIKVLTDTKMHLESIMMPIFKMILEDCPTQILPTYEKKNYKYVFPNGSEIQFAGSDGRHYEKLRGQSASLVLVDEAGFCNDLEDAVKSVLVPTTTHTGGRIILASTPPREEKHDFYEFIEEADLKGLLIKKTIYDNPLLKPDDINRLAEEVGGFNSNRFKREYLVECIRSEDNIVFPEFTDELIKETVRLHKRPTHFDGYVAMDLGGKDLSAVVFGYYDFKEAKIIIEDEFIMDFTIKGNDLKKFSEGILEKEKELWTNLISNEKKDPYQRVSDINPIVTQEINSITHGRLYFGTVKKDDKMAAINHLRSLLQMKKVVIDPKCKTLILHLKHCKWFPNKDRVEFARHVGYGHYDAAQALVYFVRTVNLLKNPYPAGYDLNLTPGNNHIMKNSTLTYNPSNVAQVFQKAFKLPVRRK